MQKIELSIATKVIYILNINANRYLSVKQIQELYEKRYEKAIKFQQVVSAIDQYNFATDAITESIERRGIKKIPTKVFTILKNIECLD